MEKIVLISGMKCDGCANRVKNVLSDIKGIKKINVSFKEGNATFVTKKDIDDSIIKEKIEGLGFKVLEIK